MNVKQAKRPGIDCPHCGEDVGYWSIFFAAIPTYIKCRNCKRTVSYDLISMLPPLLLAVLVLAAWWWISSAYDLGVYVGADLKFASEMALLVGMFFIAEFAFVGYLRSKGRLKGN